MIAFINVEFVFTFVALVYSRWLHLKYLSNYYFFENLFTLKKDIAYDFKLTFMGEQFTSHSGVFLLNDPWRGVIFDFPVNLDFPEADVEKMKMSSVEVRGSYRAEHFYSNVYFEMDWPEEFAQAAAVIPSVKVQFRQRIPVRVKSRMNVIFFPLSFLVNLTPLGAARSRYIGVRPPLSRTCLESMHSPLCCSLPTFPFSLHVHHHTITPPHASGQVHMSSLSRPLPPTPYKLHTHTSHTLHPVIAHTPTRMLCVNCAR